MDINYYKSFDCIEDDWNTTFYNSSSSYFCSLQWHKLVLELYKDTFLTKRLNSLHYFIANPNKKSQEKVIGFFYLTTQKKGKVVNFSHLLGPSDYYDFVYSDKVSSAFLSEIVYKICCDYNAVGINFSHIKKESVLADVINNLSINQIETLDCVAIFLPDDYDAYFKTLSKKVRQNIRTAYNRLNKSGLSYGFEVFTSSDFYLIDFLKLKELYVKRNAHRNEKLHCKSLLYKKINYLFSKEKDMFELESLRVTEFTLGVFKIEGNIAAYFFGFERNSRIEVNRVVIDNEFRFYSPGLIVLNEFIKKAIPRGLKVFDLTVGDEKYKYDLGGVTNQIVNIKLDLDDCNFKG